MSKRRRAAGEGTIYFDERRELWVAARTVGYTPAGNPRRVKGYGRTQMKARQKLERKLRELGELAGSGGLEADAGRVTVKEWLERWLAYKAKVAGRRPSTVERYGQVVACHLVPAFGSVRLASLRPAHVERLMVSMAEDGLSPRSVGYAWATLNNALGHAVRRGLVGRNICNQVEKPGQAPARPVALEVEEVRRLLAEARRSSRHWALYHLAVTTGMRRGELLALEWSDVDLVEGFCRVTKSQDTLGRITEPKTETSRRRVPLAPGDVEVLELHRAELEEHIARCEEYGRRWDGSERVWPSVRGTPTGARNLYRDFKAVIRRCNTVDKELVEPPLVRPVAFHALRHTAATLALRAGVPVHVVSRRLGHRDAAVTMRIYAHVLADQAQAGALELDELLEGVQAPAVEVAAAEASELEGPVN